MKSTTPVSAAFFSSPTLQLSTGSAKSSGATPSNFKNSAS